MSFGGGDSFMRDVIADLRRDFYNELAIKDPRAQVKILKADVPSPMPVVREDPWVPDGDLAYAIAADSRLGVRRTVLLPMFNRYGERHPQRFVGVPIPTPLWTRHMLGVREAARDRRRRR